MKKALKTITIFFACTSVGLTGFQHSVVCLREVGHAAIESSVNLTCVPAASTATQRHAGRLTRRPADENEHCGKCIDIHMPAGLLKKHITAQREMPYRPKPIVNLGGRFFLSQISRLTVLRSSLSLTAPDFALHCIRTVVLLT